MVTIPISMANLITILKYIGLGDLSWSILHLWATSNQESEIDILDLEEKTKAIFGYQLDWDSLLVIASQLEQVNECTIVGVNPAESLPSRSLSQKDLRMLCHVVIEAVDSSYWEIYVKDEVLSQQLMEMFR